jgi:hypothetical protein
MIDYDRDYYFDYFGFKTLERAYLLKIKITDTEEENTIKEFIIQDNVELDSIDLDDKINIDYLNYINCKKIVKIDLDDLIHEEYPYHDEGYYYECRYVKKRYYINEEKNYVYYNGLYIENVANTNNIFYPNFISKYLSTSLSILDMLFYIK